jgi:hypothetical protein
MPASLDADSLVARVRERLSAADRDQVPEQDIRKLVEQLELADCRLGRPAPRLVVRRLRFTGAKQLSGSPDPVPIHYDQAFTPGVNFLLIPDNGVGKSSVLKVIIWALTGNDDLQQVVRDWITDVWLEFGLDDRVYTTVLARREGRHHGLLRVGTDERVIEEASADAAGQVFCEQGIDAIRLALQRFFFREYDLARLRWVQKNAAGGAPVEAGTSWATYFLALRIPDDLHDYLICTDKQSFGNQQGLILSSLLGLHLVEPINQLAVMASRQKRQKEQATQVSAEAQEEVVRLQTELGEVQGRIEQLQAALEQRRQAIRTDEPTRRLVEVRRGLVEREAECRRLDEEERDQGARLRSLNARARQLREAARLRLYFTGLEVTRCPGCAATVAPEDVAAEEQTHHCRLCHRPAAGANDTEVALLEEQASGAEQEADRTRQGLDAVRRRLATLRGEIQQMAAQAQALAQALEQGPGYALPTTQEEADRMALYGEVGRINALLTQARQRAGSEQDDADPDRPGRLIEKVRDLLREIAATRNAEILGRLDALTGQLARTIGADHITEVSCTELGGVTLKKNAVAVSFKKLGSPGECFRVKLAFFLAMMRLGSEPGRGRHPGLLLIDQPGASEMVREDALALARELRHLDAELSGQLQIICCSARQEFAEATDRSKVYGPQAGKYAF